VIFKPMCVAVAALRSLCSSSHSIHTVSPTASAVVGVIVTMATEPAPAALVCAYSDALVIWPVPTDA
jgi:hypothetical protein